MTAVLLVIHIIIALVMVGIILLQKNEGGGLGMGGGNMGGLMTVRGTANLLTRITAVLAALFFLSTLGLALVFKGSNKPKSILDTPHNLASVPSSESQEEKKNPENVAVNKHESSKEETPLKENSHEGAHSNPINSLKTKKAQ
jgi:preprotein translocase subunit SecG